MESYRIYSIEKTIFHYVGYNYKFKEKFIKDQQTGFKPIY